MPPRFLYLTLGSLALAGCGDDPVSYSAPVGINLKAKSANSTNGVVTDEKGINTESGNPFGAFVTDARRELGRDPGYIDVDEVTVLLGAGSTGVTRLGEVFTGNVEVLFQMNDTNNTYPVASGTIGFFDERLQKLDACDNSGRTAEVLLSAQESNLSEVGSTLIRLREIAVQGASVEVEPALHEEREHAGEDAEKQ